MKHPRNRFCLFLFVALINSNLFAQDSIHNSGFEDWTNYGTYEDPDNWITENQATSISGVVTATKSTDAHSGNYAIRLETKQVITETVPGTAISGALNPLSLLIDIGVPINIRPDSMCGWYKYIPFPADLGSIEIILTKYNPTTKLRDLVGSGIFVATPAANYTQFTIAIIYLTTDPADLPDTAVVSLISGSQTFAAGSVLYVDDICLVYTPTPPPADIEDFTETGFSVYPNPASEFINIDLLGKSSRDATFQLYDITGKIVMKLPGPRASNSFAVNGLNIGLYYFQVISSDGSLIKTGKITIYR